MVQFNRNEPFGGNQVVVGARDELLKGGGRIKVRCVKIEEPNGETRWLYDSEAITQYLEQRFAH